MKLTQASLVAGLAMASSAVANIGPGIDHSVGKLQNLYERNLAAGHYNHLIKRRHSYSLAPRADRNAANQAQIKDASQECTTYSLPELAPILKNFPTPWENATIVDGDTEAQQVWSQIQQSGIIPTGIKQKGTANGDFSAFTPTYDRSDPDCWWTFNGCVHPKHDKIPVDTYTCPEASTWGLTFDDGPNCTHNAFYDFLQDNKQKATLFYIGSNVLDWPLEAQRGLVDGHHICVHTWSHQYMTSFPDEQVFAELYYTAKAIKDVIGITPTCWRPPYGDTDDRVRAIATGLGLETIIWTDDTDDWQVLPMGTKPTSVIEANYKSIIAKETQGASAGQGNIVLTHEISAGTMDMFMAQYANIKNVFKHIVPLTACKNQTKPYPEDITYPNFADYIAGNIEPEGIPSGTTIKASDSDYKPQLAVSHTSSGGASATGGNSAQVTGQGKSVSKASQKTSDAPAQSKAPTVAIAALATCFIGAAVYLM